VIHHRGGSLQLITNVRGRVDWPKARLADLLPHRWNALRSNPAETA